MLRYAAMMANVVLQRGEARCCDDGQHCTIAWKSKIFVFSLLSAMLGSNSFKSPQGFLYLVLYFYTRKKKEERENLLIYSRIRHSPFGFAFPSSFIPSFVGWKRCTSTNSSSSKNTTNSSSTTNNNTNIKNTSNSITNKRNSRT